jgi:photosystem II stability/assembly factor-like uncharacterized protein
MNRSVRHFLMFVLCLVLSVSGMLAGKTYASSMGWVEGRPAGDVNLEWSALASDSTGVHLVAAAYGGRLYTSSDGGANWTERQPAGNVNGNWMTVASDADGSNLLAANNGGRVYISTNSGVNWTETRPLGFVANLYWRACASDDDGSNLVVAANQGYLYTSSNGGTSWTKRTPGGDTNRYWYGAASDADGSNLIACALNGDVYTSSDSGETWTVRQPGGASHEQWYAVTSDADGSNLIAVFANSGADGRIYASSDSGATWTARWPAGVNVSKQWYSAASDNDGSVLLVANGERLYRSQDSGLTWTEERPAGDKDVRWTCCSSADGSHLVVGNHAGGRIYTLAIGQAPKQTVIVLQIGNSKFTVNGASAALDSPPVIKNARTLVPIRAIIEALGGTVGWDGTARKATVTLGSTTIELWIGKNAARVKGVSTPVDATNAKVVPEIINGRTMLPLRFVSENLGCSVVWTAATRTITITYQP